MTAREAPAAETVVSRPSFQPYVVRDSRRSIDEVFASVNNQVYQSYSGDYEYGTPEKPVAACLFEFEKLLGALAGIPHVEFVSHHTLLSEPCPADRIRIGIRHDIDSDIVSAVAQAELEQQYGVVANWCVLHTAAYYGHFDRGVFHRHDSMGAIYLKLQELGHEVSAHTDPLMVYQHHRIDGAEALVTEIEWMRSIGIRIQGSTAHNHKPAYGAENYEIFKGYFDVQDRVAPEAAPDHVVHNGRWAPLRVLDERSLGLDYEGNQVFWQKHTPLEYGAIRLANQWNWHAHRRRLRDDRSLLETPFIDQDRMLQEILKIPLGHYLVLVVHPCYYGNRHRRHSAPPRRLNDLQTAHHRELGWFTHKPGRPQSWSGPADQAQAFQTINTPNDAGMLDRLWAREVSDDDRSGLLFLGAEQIDGLPVPVPAQMQVRLAELVAHHRERPIPTTKLAFPGMGACRLWSWYERSEEALHPGTVIVGIGDQAVRQNVPSVWSRETGCSLHYPPGDYLGWDADQKQVKPVRYSPEWRIHRRDPFGLERAPECDLTLDRIMADSTGFEVGGTDCFDLVTAIYRHLLDAIRGHGSRVLLLVEANGEAAGLYDEGANDDERRTYQSAVRARLEQIAERLEAPLIDPYPRFEGEAAHHTADRRWSPTGHRLAADAVYRALVEEGII